MIDQRIVDRVDALLSKGELVLHSAASAAPRRPTRSRGITELTMPAYPDYGQWSEWRSQSLSFLRRILGDSDTYAVHFDDITRVCDVSDTKAGLGILRAVRDDIEHGNLARLPELVRADLFSDFLEMAEHLLDTKYKDPAAVLGGGVLDEHLRLLSAKHNIPTSVGSKPMKAAQLNDELKKAGVYDKNQHFLVTAWLGTRNSAAHAEYEKYTAGDVERFLGGIREFVARFPA